MSMRAASMQAVVGLAVALIGLLHAAAAVAQTPARVSVESPQPAEFGERFSLTGTISAERSARLSPRVDGLVAEVLVDAGDEVAAGDVLLRQDDAVARQALARLRAQAAEAQAQVDESKRLLAEARQLVDKSFVPASQVATRQADLNLAEAALASARAAQREQSELVARHELPAPFAGVVAAKLAETGEWVQRGTPVLELIDLDSLRIDVQVPQERHAELRAGASYQLLPDVAGAQPVPAQVQALLPVIDPSARTFLLRLRPQAGDQALLAGGSTRVEIALPAREPALAVSRDALLRRPDGSHTLFVIERGEAGGWVARERSVRVLRDAGTQVAIAEGLNADDRVVVRGNEALRDGQSVDLAGD